MSTDLERRLRDELIGLAATTRTAPGALDAIVERAGRRRRAGRALLVVAAAVLAAVLVLAGVVVARDGEGDGQRVTADIPPGPPTVTGTVVAAVETNPCVGNCLSGDVRFDLSDPGAVEVLGRDGRWAEPVEYGREAPDALPDGRYLDVDANATTVVVDPASGEELMVGAVRVLSADVLKDGRVVIVAVDGISDRTRVGVVDPGGAGLVDRTVPAGFRPYAVAGGPDGRLAVLGDSEECCLNKPALLIVEPDGTEVVHDLSGPLDGRRSLVLGDPELSWSAAGPIAVSMDLPEPYIAGQAARGWTVVIDPGDGERIAAIDGWQGLAWSPDGRGLLVARRAGTRSSELAVLWGPELSERIDLGSVPLPVLPRFWLP